MNSQQRDFYDLLGLLWLHCRRSRCTYSLLSLHECKDRASRGGQWLMAAALEPLTPSVLGGSGAPPWVMPSLWAQCCRHFSLPDGPRSFPGVLRCDMNAESQSLTNRCFPHMYCILEVVRGQSELVEVSFIKMLGLSVCVCWRVRGRYWAREEEVTMYAARIM